MGTMEFSIPDDVAQAFDETFKDENKSAIVTELMRRAVARVAEQRASGRKSGDFLDRIRERVASSDKVYTDDDIRRIRAEMRD